MAYQNAVVCRRTQVWSPKDPRGGLISYLRNLRDMVAAQCSAIPYAGMADVILKHGRCWDAPGSRRGHRLGTIKQCFSNSQRLATLHPGLTYVEGYVASIIPIHHGWCVDQTGAVIDVTLREFGSAYVGVPFRTSYLQKISSSTGWWTALLDNWESDPPQPIIHGNHPVADWFEESFHFGQPLEQTQEEQT